ncbi:MAG: SRPBCC family protein [Rhizobiaceae bacterium]|nr:SRPBCC family protein [Rhizobiaceae bacterium]
MSEPSNEVHELSITRFIAAAPETVYRVWTTRTGEWWAPLPYTTPGVEFDLRPGGICRVDMQAPDGTAMPNEGVFLEVVPNRRIVSTDAFKIGWVPQAAFMTMIVTFEPEGTGTRYTAKARHWTAEACRQHQEMGFQEGWGVVAGQLAALAEAAEAPG